MRRLLPVCDRLIWYMHEDFFLNADIRMDVVRQIEQFMIDNNAKLIKACGMKSADPDNEQLSWSRVKGLVIYGSRVPGAEHIYVYHKSNGNMISNLSHQVSLWDRDFFLSTITNGFTPWDHETRGQVHGDDVLYAWTGDMPFPYTEALKGDQYRPGGREMFTEAMSSYGT